MRSFCSSTLSRANSLVAFATSVAAQFLPKSNRSWEAVTVAWVCRLIVLSVMFCPVPATVTWFTDFCWNAVHRPLTWGRRGDRACATRCCAAR